MNQSLPKSHRIRQQACFDILFKTGQRKENRSIRIYFKQQNTVIHQIAVVASRKLGNAVKRNKAKRRMREIFRLNQHRLIPGIQMVMVAKPALLEEPFRQSEYEWLKLMSKIQLISNHKAS